jgi:radical SAM protein with 4Fe4S-binding SPASM domain
MDTWRLADAVTLRPEAFGGIAFHRERGVTLEVDAEAYRFLCAYLAPCPLPPPDHPAARLVPQLARLGFVESVKNGQRQAQAILDPLWPGDGFTLSAPETVHLAITARCNLSCPGCYVPRFDTELELTTAELRGLIDQWAQMRVFQLAVGGGEPLLREDLFGVLAYAREQGIVPNLTTNGTLLTPDVVRRLERAGVARANLSWNDIPSESEDGSGNGRQGQGRAVTQALRMLLDSTLRVGVNLLITPSLLPRLPHVLARLQALGVRQVTILRPKPPAIPSDEGRAWYEANKLRRAELLCLRDLLNAWQGVLHLEVDSALVSLMGDVDPALLRWRGIYGCTAGRRICTVWPNGRVTACSFLADLSAGDVRQVPFAELWRRGKNWEVLRDPAGRPQGGCADCDIATQCGGARCVARHEHRDGATVPSGRWIEGLLVGDVECPYHSEEV